MVQGITDYTGVTKVTNVAKPQRLKKSSYTHEKCITHNARVGGRERSGVGGRVHQTSLRFLPSPLKYCKTPK